jgi:hypothetical protein
MHEAAKKEGPPTTFEDFFKNQSNNAPISRPPLPEKRFEKNNSSSNFNLGSPEDIINDDELNNSSVASRRGRPPMRKSPQQKNQESDIPLLNNNRS